MYNLMVRRANCMCTTLNDLLTTGGPFKCFVTVCLLVAMLTHLKEYLMNYPNYDSEIEITHLNKSQSSDNQ